MLTCVLTLLLVSVMGLDPAGSSTGGTAAAPRTCVKSPGLTKHSVRLLLLHFCWGLLFAFLIQEWCPLAQSFACSSLSARWLYPLFALFPLDFFGEDRKLRPLCLIESVEAGVGGADLLPNPVRAGFSSPQSFSWLRERGYRTPHM